MNMQEYTALKQRYAINEQSWGELARKLAFYEFDCALEEYVENEKEEWNGGKSLMDVSAADVERIIEEYLWRESERVAPVQTEAMRDAIQAVTGLVC